MGLYQTKNLSTANETINRVKRQYKNRRKSLAALCLTEVYYPIMSFYFKLSWYI